MPCHGSRCSTTERCCSPQLEAAASCLACCLYFCALRQSVHDGDSMLRTVCHWPSTQQRRPLPRRRAPASPCVGALQHTDELHWIARSRQSMHTTILGKPSMNSAIVSDPAVCRTVSRRCLGLLRLTASAVVGTERPAPWAGRTGGLPRQVLEGAACKCRAQKL